MNKIFCSSLDIHWCGRPPTFDIQVTGEAEADKLERELTKAKTIQVFFTGPTGVQLKREPVLLRLSPETATPSPSPSPANFAEVDLKPGEKLI